jgi:hypothetical protein
MLLSRYGEASKISDVGGPDIAFNYSKDHKLPDIAGSSGRIAEVCPRRRYVVRPNVCIPPDQGGRGRYVPPP